MSLRPLIRTGAVLLVLCVPLGACGKLGQLEKPGPLAGQQQSPTPTHMDTIDPRDRDSDPAPPHDVPIHGEGQDPFAAGPPQALPDPFNQPPR